MITPVNSIMIPGRFVTVCNNWHNGIGDMLYAVASTGNLTTGTNRPLDCNTDEEWYLMLWRALSNDVDDARQEAQFARETDSDCLSDVAIFEDFRGWVNTVCEELSKEYALKPYYTSNMAGSGQ